MIGKIINELRNEKGLNLIDVAKAADINEGHLSHIEKGERYPSYKTLKAIAEALGVSSAQLLNYTGKTMNEEQEQYNYAKYVPYNYIPVVDIKEYVYKECGDKNILAVIVPDDSMETKIKKDSRVFVELYAPVNNGDIGLFLYNGKVLLRKFVLRSNKIKLEAYNKEYKTIEIKEEDTFSIIGKITD